MQQLTIFCVLLFAVVLGHGFLIAMAFSRIASLERYVAGLLGSVRNARSGPSG